MNKCFIHVLVFGLMTLILTSFAGCRNTTPGETNTPGLDACTLLTKREVTDILHDAFADPNHKIQRDDDGRIALSSCTFVPVGNHSFSTLNLLVISRQDASHPARAIEDHIRPLKQALGDKGFSLVTVNGIGEAAGYAPTTGQLFVFDNKRLLVLTLHHPSTDRVKALLIKLAHATLAE